MLPMDVMEAAYVGLILLFAGGHLLHSPAAQVQDLTFDNSERKYARGIPADTLDMNIQGPS